MLCELKLELIDPVLIESNGPQDIRRTTKLRFVVRLVEHLWSPPRKGMSRGGWGQRSFNLLILDSQIKNNFKCLRAGFTQQIIKILEFFILLLHYFLELLVLRCQCLFV